MDLCDAWMSWAGIILILESISPSWSPSLSSLFVQLIWETDLTHRIIYWRLCGSTTLNRSWKTAVETPEPANYTCTRLTLVCTPRFPFEVRKECTSDNCDIASCCSFRSSFQRFIVLRGLVDMVYKGLNTVTNNRSCKGRMSEIHAHVRNFYGFPRATSRLFLLIASFVVVWLQSRNQNWLAENCWRLWAFKSSSSSAWKILQFGR